MPPITGLPKDLLVSIFDFLSSRDHYALSFACRATNEAAIPCLYREVQCTATRSRVCARKSALLLRTLLEHPKRAAHIQIIRLGGSHRCWTEYDPWSHAGNTAGNDGPWRLRRCALLSSAQIANVSKRLQDNIAASSPGHSSALALDALITALLTMCPEVHTLGVDDGFLRYSKLLPSIVKQSGRFFPKLKHVTLGDERPNREKSIPYVDLDLIRPVFFSATITNFACTMVEPWQFSWNSATSPRITTLTSIRLMRTNITRSTLTHILSATPNLKAFYYEHEIVFDDSSIESPSSIPYLELEGLNAALTHVQSTLEECELIIRLAPGHIPASEYPDCGIPFPSIDGTLSLKSMPRLKKAQIPLVMFFGWFPKFSSRLEDVLPPSITELTLRDDLVPYCPWSSRLSSRERRIARVGKYIRDRNTLAPFLDLVQIRLTGAKVLLRDAVQGIRNATSGGDIKTSVIRGAKSETYIWSFKPAGFDHLRPRLGARVDSIIRSASDSDSSPPHSHVVSAVQEEG